MTVAPCSSYQACARSSHTRLDAHTATPQAAAVQSEKPHVRAESRPLTGVESVRSSDHQGPQTPLPVLLRTPGAPGLAARHSRQCLSSAVVDTRPLILRPSPRRIVRMRQDHPLPPAENRRAGVRRIPDRSRQCPLMTGGELGQRDVRIPNARGLFPYSMASAPEVSLST